MPTRHQRLRLPALAVALALSLAGIEPVCAQETVVKMATLVPDGSKWHLVLKEMAEAWKTASAGRVVVRLYPGGVAGDDPDVIRKMRLGTLSGGVLTSVGLAEVDRSVYALSLPLVYTSYDEVYWVLEQMRPGLEASLEARGFVVLNWMDGGWTRFFAQKPVATPDDLRGLRLFSWANDPDSLEVWKAAGFSPVSLPTTELGTALQKGLVNALGVSPQVAVISQYYTKAGHMTDLPWQLVLGATVVSKATWDKVPEDLKPALRKSAQEAGQRLREEIRGSDERDIEEMKKRGLRVVAVGARAREEWKKTAEAMFPRVRGTIVPAAAFDEALRLRDEYRRLRTDHSRGRAISRVNDPLRSRRHFGPLRAGTRSGDTMELFATLPDGR
jgi:TRAP-type C4-dicarboxylate transport system substrate-binding protein